MPSDKTEKTYVTNSGRHAPSSTEVPLVAIAVVTGAHGIRGQVKIRSFTDDPYALVDYAPLLNASGSKRYALRIDGDNKGMLIASFKGVQDRNAAEALKGTQLYIEKSRLPAPSEDEFYYDDLIGLEVRDDAGAVLGHVAALYDFGAGDIIELKLASGGKEMYPFTRESFPDIRIAEGYLRAILPEIVEAKGKKE